MESIKAKVVECSKKSFEGREYYVLLVQGDSFPIGKVSSRQQYAVGSTVTLGFGRKEADMRLVVRVLD